MGFVGHTVHYSLEGTQIQEFAVVVPVVASWNPNQLGRYPYKYIVSSN
jgi:hypothetical protein